MRQPQRPRVGVGRHRPVPGRLARRHHLARRVYDHTSILEAIEWRWGLPPLTPRDRHARNIAEVLDFSAQDLTAPTWNVPLVAPSPCGDPARPAGPATEHELTWRALVDLARRHGFPVPAATVRRPG